MKNSTTLFWTIAASILASGVVFAMSPDQQTTHEVQTLPAMTFDEASELCEDREHESEVKNASYRIASDGTYLFCKDQGGTTFWRSTIRPFMVSPV